MGDKTKLDLIEGIMRENSGVFKRSEDMLILARELAECKEWVGHMVMSAAAVASFIAEGDSASEAVAKVDGLLKSGAPTALAHLAADYALSAMADGHEEAVDYMRLLVYNFVDVEKKATKLGIMFAQILALYEVIPGLEQREAVMEIVKLAQQEDCLGLEIVIDMRGRTEDSVTFASSLFASTNVGVSLGVVEPKKWKEMLDLTLKIAKHGRDRAAGMIGIDVASFGAIDDLGDSIGSDFSELNLTPDSLSFLKGLTKKDE